ncbi:MAG: methyl-accepting chemotaxis protein, partial [Nocardioidaceae bacterium]
MTIGRQVAAGFAACLTGLLLVAVMATIALSSAAASKNQILDQRVPLVNRAHELDAVFATQTATARGFLISGDERLVAQVDELDADFELLLDQMEASRPSRELSSVLTAIAASHAEWNAAFDGLAEDRRTRDGVAAVAERVESELFPAYDRVRAALQDVVAMEQVAIGDDIETSDRDQQRIVLLLWVMVAVTFLVAVTLAVWVTRRVATSLSDLASRVDTAAHEILAGVSQQVSGATEQAAAVQQTVATVEELVQTAEQAVERAQSVAGRAQESVEVADRGSEAIDESTTGMEQIRDQVGMIAESILDLTKRAQSIGEVVDTVESIAAETHLLALNAAIEAARAGEYG